MTSDAPSHANFLAITVDRVAYQLHNWFGWRLRWLVSGISARRWCDESDWLLLLEGLGASDMSYVENLYMEKLVSQFMEGPPF